ncbi:hypothetical protein FOL47_002567 [Perkinsus chesapeaki]|uniref:CCHC-type domain-containing protein n=1 Tax=Perkinsus chesapeaki TaxID=330153 RepID=A0A7J6MDC0_PERCH|nr:hypothetical protein FOL47_002567 [Perkinsus chesapeaki]
MSTSRERSRSRDGVTERCINCGGRGHTAAQCPSPIMQGEVEGQLQVTSAPPDRTSRTETSRPPFQGKCANCFRYGHRARECPNATTCTKCFQSGHSSKDCPVNQETCGRCRRVGHSAETCPNPILCDKCGEYGHPAVWCGVKCHNCGGTGHMIKQCPEPPLCRICKKAGHKSGECQMRHGRYEIRTDAESPLPLLWHAGVQCLQCLQYGHMARDCPNPRVCHRCGEPGHESRSCPNPLRNRVIVGQYADAAAGRTVVAANVPFGMIQGTGAGRRDSSGVQCLQCLQYGHIARHCPNPRACHRCGMTGHESRMCPQAGQQHNQYGTSGVAAWVCDSTVQCLQCLGFGHMARSCPNRRVCHRCGQPGHESKRCHLGPGPTLVTQTVPSTTQKN